LLPRHSTFDSYQNVQLKSRIFAYPLSFVGLFVTQTGTSSTWATIVSKNITMCRISLNFVAHFLEKQVFIWNSFGEVGSILYRSRGKCSIWLSPRSPLCCKTNLAIFFRSFLNLFLEFKASNDFIKLPTEAAMYPHTGVHIYVTPSPAPSLSRTSLSPGSLNRLI